MRVFGANAQDLNVGTLIWFGHSTDTTQGARTIEETSRLCMEKAKSKRYNASREPLFTTIPLTNVVIDNLHLFLRVTDVLIDHVIVELRRRDGIEKLSRFSSFDRHKYRYLAAYEHFVSSLGIPSFNFYIGKT